MNQKNTEREIEKLSTKRQKVLDFLGLSDVLWCLFTRQYRVSNELLRELNKGLKNDDEY